MLHFLSTSGGDQLGQWLSPQSGEGKINDLGVRKKIKKKRLNRLRRIGAA
jgi:hypothetical protein